MVIIRSQTDRDNENLLASCPVFVDYGRAVSEAPAACAVTPDRN